MTIMFTMIIMRTLDNPIKSRNEVLGVWGGSTASQRRNGTSASWSFVGHVGQFGYLFVLFNHFGQCWQLFANRKKTPAATPIPKPVRRGRNVY